MRKAFVDRLVDLAAADERIVLVTGDLGFTVLEPFRERFGDRFFNVGVAEQDLIGLATGLAEAGLVPFAYSIATFASLRPLEFWRNGPVHHRLPVRLVGIGGGFEYGPAGPSHHALEDLALMRLLPPTIVVAPADGPQAAAALAATWNAPGPIYYRIGKDDATVVPGLDGRFRPGRTEALRRGTDLVLLTTGAVAACVVDAARRLAADGVEAAVVLVPTLAPAPVDDLLAALDGHRVALTVEGHSATGGLGSLVCEVVAEHGLPCRIVRRGAVPAGGGRSGSRDWYRDRCGLSADRLVEAARELVGR